MRVTGHRSFATTTRSVLISFFAAFIALSFVFAMGIGRAGASQPSGSVVVANQADGLYSPAGAPAKTAEIVTGGMYAVNAYEIDTSANTFQFKAYFWMRWKGPINPVSTMEFANSVEEWGLMVTNLTANPQKLPGGYELQQMRVQGRFFEPFNLKNYPLDSQKLQVTLEDTVYNNTQIVYVPDSSNTTWDSHFKVPGWNITGVSVDKLNHNYVSNFGDPASKDNVYSALTFAIDITRASNMFWLKLLLPLIFVLITGWLALLLSPKYTEIRTAMPATALLTTVFLQQSSLDAIPGVSTLTLMDLIYVIAYGTIVITFGQIIWDNHRLKSEEEDLIAKVTRHDRISFAVQVLGSVALFIVLLMTHK